MKPIEHFSTDEILIELCKRFDHYIFAGRLDKSAKQVKRVRFYKGDYDICAGLIHGPMQAAVEDNWGINGANVVNYEGT